MSKSNSIPPGYQIHVHSYENDGDNCKVSIKSGLTEPQARLHVFIAKAFSSSGRGLEESPVVGNDENSASAYLELWDQAMSLFPETAEEYYPAADLPTLEEMELIDDLLRLRYNDPRKEYPKYDAVRNYQCRARKFLGFITEMIDEMLESPSEGYCDLHLYHRAEDGIQVYYVPGDIENVTNQFINQKGNAIV